jgi:hypothetical protein
VPAGTTSVTIAPEFMQNGAVYKFEVVAIKERLNEDNEPVKGNQSISENFFCTLGVNPCELLE